jgi:hypothetical protein
VRLLLKGSQERRLFFEKRLKSAKSETMRRLEISIIANPLISETMRRLEISIIANPLINIHLQGRFDAYQKRRGRRLLSFSSLEELT